MGTRDAIAHGITSSAGVVTSAALVMVAVFSIFATLSALEFKQMGVGLAAAILIDATIVRGPLRHDQPGRGQDEAELQPWSSGGSRRSGRGSHQFRSPNRLMAAGSRTARQIGHGTTTSSRSTDSGERIGQQ
jgi:hypothetical protein